MKILFFLCLVFQSMTNVVAVERVDLHSRIVKMHINYKLNNDFTVVTTSEIEIQPLTEELVKKTKRQVFSHSTSIEKLEILEAYTKKVNGKTVPVPKGNYQITVNKGKGDASGLFSDITYVNIVYPELEKNDTVYVRVSLTETEPMFPGHFSKTGFFFNQTAFDDVLIRFDLPIDLKYQFESRQMTEKIDTKNGRKLIELTYRNSHPLKKDRKDYSVWDESKEAGYAISTFSDYSEIARAYARRATPKAIPSKRVIELAHDIVTDRKDKKAQARLLYDWVSTHISYSGNCIGVGAVVPHDTDFILNNLMGDCKDHATLLEALYRAVGIESVQALINASNVYELPKIPLVSAIDHVINYIPEWDQFVDSTSAIMPFELLPPNLWDKPVVLVNGDTPRKRTPVVRYGANRQELDATMSVQGDGSVDGTIKIRLAGLPAVNARNAWRNATAQQEQEWLEKQFGSRNKKGSGAVEKDDPRPLLPTYKYSVDFHAPDYLVSKGTAGFYVKPIADGPKGVLSYLNYEQEDIAGYDVACGNGSAIERLNFTFPDNVKILAKPDDFSINENDFEFSSHFALEGNKLSVERKIIDRTPTNVCSAEYINSQRSTLKKIIESLQSQVIYQIK